MMPTDSTSTARLQARGVTIGYDEQAVVHDLSLDVIDGSVTAIIGPNGCGKSTLLRSMARLLSPTSGDVLLDGELIRSMGSKEVARRMALLPQTPIAPDGLRVADLVARGRHPHQKWFQQWSPDDEASVDEALAWTDISELKNRSLDRLSGGQRQRAWIAMALAQDTGLLLLDEPTTYLDLAHQIEVLDLVARLNRERGRTVVMVLHDLNLAARYADVIVVMQQGRIVAKGPSTEVFTPELLDDVFGLSADVIPDPRTGLPIIVPTSCARHLTRESVGV